jgi:hypothetical protein
MGHRSRAGVQRQLGAWIRRAGTRPRSLFDLPFPARGTALDSRGGPRRRPGRRAPGSGRFAPGGSGAESAGECAAASQRPPAAPSRSDQPAGCPAGSAAARAPGPGRGSRQSGSAPEIRSATEKRGKEADQEGLMKTSKAPSSPWCNAGFGQDAQKPGRNKGLSHKITPDFGHSAQN